MFRMVSLLVCAFSLIAVNTFAQQPPQMPKMGPMTEGSGLYKPAIVEGDSSLPNHTIYRPKDLSPFSKSNTMPVLVWGNGGCSSSSRMHANFLAEVASHGFLVLALGPYVAKSYTEEGGTMGMGSSTKSAQMLEAMDWATAENKRPDSKFYGKLDPSKLAIAGMSCGGLQALEVASDPRVKTLMVMNSGLFGPGGRPKMAPPKEGMPKTGAPKQGGAPLMGMPEVGKEALKKLHSPTIYIIGGKSDIAYPQAIDDYAKIDKVPVAIANLDVGHGGTYHEPNGGEFGVVAGAWLRWQLKGNKEDGKMFTGTDCGMCTRKGWTFEKKNLP